MATYRINGIRDSATIADIEKVAQIQFFCPNPKCQRPMMGHMSDRRKATITIKEMRDAGLCDTCKAKATPADKGPTVSASRQVSPS